MGKPQRAYSQVVRVFVVLLVHSQMAQCYPSLDCKNPTRRHPYDTSTCVISVTINSEDNPYYDEYGNNHAMKTFPIQLPRYGYYKKLSCVACTMGLLTRQSIRLGAVGLTILDLSNSSINGLKPNAISNKYGANIVELDLNSNRIESLSEEMMFSSTLALEVILLKGNQIHTIHQDAFCGLNHLRKIDLSNNRLTTIDGKLFRDTAIHIIEIYLQFNLIENVTNTKDISARLLDISANPLLDNNDNDLNINAKEVRLVESQLSARCLFGEDIEKLNAPRNAISSVDLSNSPDLSVLDLQSNNLSSLDLRHNNKLTTLNLQFNEFAELDLSNCPLLTNISVGYNYLHTITVAAAERLTFLEASNNLLANFSLLGCSALDRLDISNNQIEHFDINDALTLTYLNVSKNHLRTLRSSWLPSSLVVLDLSHNNLTVLEVNVFSQLAKLQVLAVRNCSIRVIQYGLLASNSLLHLDMSDNPMSQHFSLLSLFQLGNLTTLLINNCGLHQPRSFDDARALLPSLQQVGISSNPWKCADLVHVVRSLTINHINVTIEEPVLNESNIIGISCSESVPAHSILPTESTEISSSTTSLPNVTDEGTTDFTQRIHEVVLHINELENRLAKIGDQENHFDTMYPDLLKELNLIRELLDGRMQSFEESINRTLTNLSKVQRKNSQYQSRLTADERWLNRTMLEQHATLTDRVEFLAGLVERNRASDQRAMARVQSSASISAYYAFYSPLFVAFVLASSI